MPIGSQWRPLSVLGVVLVALIARSAVAQVPTPTIEGPIGGPGTPFVQATSFDLAQVGYVQEEFFLAGTASAYTNVGPLGVDGGWSVAPGVTAPYKTRIVMHRPVDPKKFKGTVVVEWLNVSGGLDAGPDWTLAHTEFIRDGWIWVGVSAQYAGVEGGGGLLGIVSLPLKTVNPARYGSLVHPGDSFSYDIFSQVAQVVRSPNGPLGAFKVKSVIASGDSQSAFRLVTYINGIHPITHVYDGYLVHSRSGAFGAPLSEAPQAVIAVPGGAMIRTDIDVPVLNFQTETDLTFLASTLARQPDGQNFRLWEVAGTSHVDTYVVVVGPADLGTSPDVVGLALTASPVPGIIDCGELINSGPQHFVFKAAFSALNRWVRRGKAPRSAPRLEVTAGPPVAITVDANGNGVGGIRTPQVDVPIATFTGQQGPGSTIICRLFGTTTPFDEAKLAALYPTHKAFVSAWNRALRRAVKAGWILKPDAKLMRKWAAGSTIGD